jgi:hypothetical protein
VATQMAMSADDDALELLTALLDATQAGTADR